MSTVSSTYARAARYFVSARPSKRWTDRLSPTGGSGREPDCRIQRRPAPGPAPSWRAAGSLPRDVREHRASEERIRLVEQRGQHTDDVRRVLRPARNSDVDLRRPHDGRRGTGTGEAALQDAGGSAPAPNRRASSAAGEPRSASDPAASARIRWVSAHNCSSISVVMLCGTICSSPGSVSERNSLAASTNMASPTSTRTGRVAPAAVWACQRPVALPVPGHRRVLPPVASRQDAPGCGRCLIEGGAPSARCHLDRAAAYIRPNSRPGA